MTPITYYALASIKYELQSALVELKPARPQPQDHLIIIIINAIIFFIAINFVPAPRSPDQMSIPLTTQWSPECWGGGEENPHWPLVGRLGFSILKWVFSKPSRCARSPRAVSSSEP